MKYTSCKFLLVLVAFALVFVSIAEANVFALERREVNAQESTDIRGGQPKEDDNSDIGHREDEMEDDEVSNIRRKGDEMEDDESEDSYIDENDRNEESEEAL